VRKLFAALLCTVLTSLAAQAQENRLSSGNVLMVMQRMTEDFVVPRYASVAEAATEFDAGVARLCTGPSAEALAAARSGFADVALAWAQVENVRFGPVMRDNRLERFLFWPDRKGTGLKQVQALLAIRDPSATDPASLAAKSVAVQGLGAAEYLLFGTGSEALSAGDAYRCRFAAAIAGNLSSIASGLVKDWSGPGGEAAMRMQTAEPEDVAASLNEMIATLVHGLEAARDIRLRGFLDVKEGRDRPKSALFWRSALTFPALRANVDGLEAFFTESAMEVLLPEDQGSIAQSIAFEFRELHDLLAIEAGVADVLSDPEGRKRLLAADLVLKSLIDRFDTQFAPATGLAAGFSFADGD